MAVAAESQFLVLAVDDSRIDRLLIERLLKTSSYQVTAVDSGSKALEFLGLSDNVNELISPNTTSSGSPSNHQELGVNLIITDYCMPGMTGYDLLRKIKESAAVKNIPVVIMSSENVPSRISRCLEEGAEEFLLKPVKLADVHRLRPHMLKAKGYTDQEKQGEEEDQEVDSEITEIQTQPQSESNKRKALDIEEIGLSPDRTRTRYNKLAVSS